MASEFSDIQQSVTDKILSCMEKGDLPWKCPWVKSGESWFPYNYASKRSYNGINVLLLWITAKEMGYTSNGWLTFDQAKSLGGQVRKGERAVRCIFYKQVPIERAKGEDGDEGEDGGRKVLFLRRSFSIFNLNQIEGIEVEAPKVIAKPEEGEPLRRLRRLAQGYSSDGLRYEHGGDRACYVPSLDVVRMPFYDVFLSENGYAATFAHELVHSTGHHSRLDRFAKNDEMFSDKKEAYAFEELIAEIGSAYICADLGIDGEYESHASYLNSWIKFLKSDKSFIFKAAAQASKAQGLLMKHSMPLVETVSQSMITSVSDCTSLKNEAKFVV